MLALSSASLSFAPALPVARPRVAAADVRMETVADLETLAEKCNPIVGFWDPLALAGSGGDGLPFKESEAIGWLRHAEIKHGRVAMAGFVGFIVQSNGIHFPWDLQNGVSYASIGEAGGPAAQWDALPTTAKVQILLFVGLLEFLGEKGQSPHYMRGGKPGDYPSLKESGLIPHPIPLDLFDPLGLSKKATPEKKERGLVAEINNGRLAMVGLFGFMAESKVPGSVPSLSGLGITPYDGEYMAPFSAANADLPFVADMLKYNLHFP